MDLETIVEIATEDEVYIDSEYARTGYVDTVTGEVHVVYLDALSCADGEIELEHLSEWSADCVEVAGKILSDIEDRYVEIERWRSSEGYDLMVEFTSEARDSKVRDRLSDALRGKKPFRRFKDTLFEWPEVREAWFAFQGHSQRNRARAWLRGFGIEAVDASLYQLPSAPNRW